MLVTVLPWPTPSPGSMLPGRGSHTWCTDHGGKRLAVSGASDRASKVQGETPLFLGCHG